jgi:hypothetical protein
MGRPRDVGGTMLHEMLTLLTLLTLLAIFNCDGIPNADYFEKLNHLVTYVQEQHIAILLETRTNELTRLSSQSHNLLPQRCQD